jgi:hypothetical protein
MIDAAIAYALSAAGIGEDRAEHALRLARPQFIIKNGQAELRQSGLHAPAWVESVLKPQHPEWFGDPRSPAEMLPLARELSRPAFERYKEAIDTRKAGDE